MLLCIQIYSCSSRCEVVPAAGSEMAAAALRTRLEATHRLLTAMRGSPCFAEASAAQSDAVALSLVHSKLDVEESAGIAEQIRAVGWHGDDMKKPLAALAGSLKGTPIVGVGRRSMQNYTRFHNFLTEGLWSTLLNEEPSAEDKLALFVKHLLMLDLRVASEPTYQRITAMFLLCTEGVDGSRNMLASAKHESFKHVKKELKHACATAMPPVEWISELPSTSSALLQEHELTFKNAFHDGGPAPCHFDESVVEQVTKSVPMRSTNRSFAQPQDSAPLVQAANSMMQHLQQVQQMQMMSMMQLGGMHRQRSWPDPAQASKFPFQFLGPAFNSGSFEISPMKNSAGIAITDGRPQPGSGPLALPPAEKPLDETPAATLAPAPFPTLPATQLLEAPPFSTSLAAAVAPTSVPKALQRCSVAEAANIVTASLTERNEEHAKEAKLAKEKAKKGLKGPKGKPKETAKKKSFLTLEKTRSQYMCRSGSGGKGSTHAVKFGKGLRTQKAALALAEAWVKIH